MAVLIPVILFQGFASAAAEGANNNNNWSEIIANIPKYVFPAVFFSNMDGPFADSGLYPLGTIVYTVVVFIVTIKISYIESRTYTLFTHLFAFASIAIWFTYQFAYSRIVAWLNSRPNSGGGQEIGFDAIGLDFQFFNAQLTIWVILVFVLALTLILCDFTFYAWMRVGNKWDKIFIHLRKQHDQEESSSSAGTAQHHRHMSSSTNSLNASGNRDSLKHTQANLAKTALAEWRRLKLSYRDWARLIPWWQKWEAKNDVNPDGF
jgi:hypothetical protein